MPFQVKYMGSIYPLTAKCFDREKKIYNCSCSALEPNSIEIPFNLPFDETYNTQDFIVYTFVRKDTNENDIFQIYDKVRDTRIGWCFPVQAIDSLEHSYADNEHFLRYASVAYKKLIEDVPQNIFLLAPNIDNAESINIGQFFADDTVIITISKSTLANVESFCLSDYLPSLFYYGYFPLDNKDPALLAYIGDTPSKNRIYIKKISEAIRNKEFIFSIFNEVIAYESNDVLAFFYLYQIIELLMERIYQNEQINMVLEIKESLENPSKIKEIFEKVNHYTSEKKRLALLMSHYLDSSPDQTDIRFACNDFLKEFGYDEGHNLSEYLYRVRNFIFHQYRDFRKERIDLLQRIVGHLSPLICEILCSFVVRDVGSAKQLH